MTNEHDGPGPVYVTVNATEGNLTRAELPNGTTENWRLASLRPRCSTHAMTKGRRDCTTGWVASLAQDHEGAQFWVVACLNERRGLVLDSQEVWLELLAEAGTFRAKVRGTRSQEKAQWLAQVG